MAFVEEDGTGLPDANCLGTLAEATTYHADRANARWSQSGTTDAQRQAALVKSTDHFERLFGSRLTGERAVDGQALSLPRVNGYDREGNELAEDEVWVGVRYAIYEYAIVALDGDLQPNPAAATDGVSGLIKRTRKKVDVIEKEIEYAEPVQQRIIRAYPKADLLVSKYLRPAGGSYR